MGAKSLKNLLVVGLMLLLGGGAFFLWRSAGDKSVANAAVTSPARTEPLAVAEPLPEEIEPPRPRTREEKRFARADRDDDGVITADEYLAARRRNFDKLDTNKDGKLEFREYAAAGFDKFSDADTNQDGKLIPKEFALTAPKSRKSAAAKPTVACEQL